MSPISRGMTLILVLASAPTQGWPSPKSQPPAWPTPQTYSLTRSTPHALDLAPPNRTTSLTTAGAEQITVTAPRRAPTIDIPSLLTDTMRSLWNVGGNPLQPQADCQQNYTTVGGQPARAADFAGPKGVRDCWF